MLKKIFEFVVLVAAAYFFIRATTHGWQHPRFTFTPKTEHLPLAEELKKHVYALSHEIGDRSAYRYEQLDRAERYITSRFLSLGYDVTFQTYKIAEKEFRNVIASKKGEEFPGEVVIVGAHYDTCANPGADDNASGVAVLLELAKAFSKENVKRTVRFIAFVNEEPPFCLSGAMGSAVYAREARKRREDIKSVLILESVGYYSRKPRSQAYPPFLGLFLPAHGDFIALVGNFPSSWLVKSVSSVFKAHSSLPMVALSLPSFISGVSFSDHSSFWKEGYPAVMFTDTAFYRNPHYHTSGDTYETLSYPHMAELALGLKKVLEGYSR